MQQLITGILLAALFTSNLCSAQIAKHGAKNPKPDQETANAIGHLVDSLPGIWELIQTIRYVKGDTISQEPSLQLWVTPGAKAFTTLVIDSTGHYKITQACMKCPMLEWEGQYDIEGGPSSKRDLYYLYFHDSLPRKHKLKKRDTRAYEFCGHIKRLEQGQLVVTDKDGRDWFYRRYIP